jgi:hypothetical protein
MPDPYDYSSAFANLPAPGASFLQGIQNGVALTDLQAQQQQKQIALAQQQQKQQVIQSLVNNPNASADDYAKAAVLVPELSAQFKQAWETKNSAQAQNDLKNMVEWSSAIQSGQPKIASDAMRARADAIENTTGAPTPESKALRAKADQVDANPQAANVILKSMIAANPNGPKAIDAIVAQNKDVRDQSESDATVAGKQADNTLKNLGIVAQRAGALAKPGTKPAQAEAMFRTLAAQGIIPKDDLQGYIDGIPSDPKEVPDYLAGIRDSGIKPDEQKKFTTPDANTVANNATSIRTTGMNNATQVKVQQMIADRENSGGDAADFTPEAIDNAAKRYNLDGTLPPMGMGAAASAGRTKILNRAAELAAGVDGTDQRQNQLNVKNQQRAMQDFTSGKLGSSVRSFNVGISHLDTLGQLADALGNKDTQSINRIGNYFATQTGNPAPTNFNAAKKIVGDEIVKAIVGAGGGVHDREEAAKVIDAANSPAQLKGAINTYKELMIGQLGGLEKQYNASTGRTDFDRFLSPQAQVLRAKHGGVAQQTTPAAPAIPAGWTVRVH